MADDALSIALRFQARACIEFGSDFYGALLERAADDPAPLRDVFAPWAQASTRELITEAAPLRFVGALHDLVLDESRPAPALAAAFPPVGDPRAAWIAAGDAIAANRARVAAFMTHEPQTNEVRRSACLLPGFLAVARETGLPLRCLELGASAGLNQFWSRFHYDYDGRGVWGDPAAPVQLTAEWRGAAPSLEARPRVADVAACDRRPIDLKDPAQRRRLAAYVWPDQPERLARLAAAIELALAAGVQVETADAVDWTLARGGPRAGVATVIYHSIFWQYLPPETSAALEAAIAAQGDAATPDAPLAWLSMEPGADPLTIELRLTTWPGAIERRLAVVNAHGAWIDWA